MNTITLGTTYLDQQKALADRMHNEFKKDTIRMYAQLAGLAVGTVAGVYVAMKIQKN